MSLGFNVFREVDRASDVDHVTHCGTVLKSAWLKVKFVDSHPEPVLD
jgi:hypothetical protein